MAKKAIENASSALSEHLEAIIQERERERGFLKAKHKGLSPYQLMLMYVNCVLDLLS